MIISVQWSEWLRRPQVRRFDSSSPIAVEDYLDGKLPTDTTVFVFDDADRPMLQSLESQWGNGRFSTKKLAEIHNALVDKERRVNKFKHRQDALIQLSLELIRQGKNAPITNVRNHVMITEHEFRSHTEDADTEQDENHRAEAAVAKVESPAEMKKRAAAAAKAEKEAAKVAKVAAAANAKAEKEAAKAAAAAAKVAAKKVKAPKPTGVIGSLIELLTDGSQRTVDELHAELLEKFPERGEGMKTTVRVQLARLGKEGRLLVHAEDRHDDEGKRLVGKNYWGESVASDTEVQAEAAE
jgi:hypothetical protein